MRLSNRVFAQSVEMGALNQLYAAVDPAAESGKFYGRDASRRARLPDEVQPVESQERGDRAAAVDTLGGADRVAWKL